MVFDFGGTHTFLAIAFVERINVLVEDLGNYLVVPTTVGATLTT